MFRSFLPHLLSAVDSFKLPKPGRMRMLRIPPSAVRELWPILGHPAVDQEQHSPNVHSICPVKSASIYECFSSGRITPILLSCLNASRRAGRKSQPRVYPYPFAPRLLILQTINREERDLCAAPRPAKRDRGQCANALELRLIMGDQTTTATAAITHSKA
jgi:hypothetical protein